MANSYLVGSCTGSSPGFAPPQDAVDVRRTPTGLLHLINSIRDQAAAFREITERVDSWQIELTSLRNDKLASEKRSASAKSGLRTFPSSTGKRLIAKR